MDQILSKAGSTIVTFAIRSSVQMASSYVIKSVNTLMDSAPDRQKKSLERLKNKLQTRIEIVTSANQLIQLVASRGNTNLESTLRVMDDLKEEIDEFEENIEYLSKQLSDNKKMTTDSFKSIESYMQGLLVKIEQAIPVINLALTTSGANLSGSLSSFVSPGRLLQSTIFINDSNKLFDLNDEKKIKVGPEFTLTYFNIFYNPATAIHGGGSGINWREKFAKCSLQIYRVPKTQNKDYCYEVEVTESFDDGRYHDDETETPTKVILRVEDIGRLFFSASGKLLKLEDRTSPVLVFKMRSKGFEAKTDEQGYEWVAVGDYLGESDEDDDEDEDESQDNGEKEGNTSGEQNKLSDLIERNMESPLSLLEYLLRLCALQEIDQISILKVKDEKLRLYLNDENGENKDNSLQGLGTSFSKLKVDNSKE